MHNNCIHPRHKTFLHCSFCRRYGATSSLSNSAGSSGAGDLSRSRSSHALKSRESSPLRSNTSSAADGQDGAALSSWARYLKNKYGNRTSKDSRDASTLSAPSASTPSSSSAATSASRRLSLGLPLRQANEITSSDDDSKNVQGSPTTTLVHIALQSIDFVVIVIIFVISVGLVSLMLPHCSF